ncbi:hypothetical protein Pcinc_013376 [Petrolisthes cinctipes]|uniref:Uncharacterized protein n=1 Tax=Petrolisthes cinctipes TaxID=88211 RepID=A0AAE1FYS4_PETCI|nr:hypothetical protein Pcinc_013376 [Petrolisthes cinctipes]
MEPLGECTIDQGPPEPQDLQVVYLRVPHKKQHWFYPPKGKWTIKSYPHQTRTITEPKDSWPKWIWHDCGEGYVCLESGRYPNYYLFVNYLFGSRYGCVRHYWTPQTSPKLKIVSKTQTPDGLLMEFAYKSGGKYQNSGIEAYVYIPPRCEGYKRLGEYNNPGPGNFSFSYTYTTGVARTESRSTTKSFSVGALLEIRKSIVGAGLLGFFSKSWTYEQSASSMELETHQISSFVPPGTKL